MDSNELITIVISIFVSNFFTFVASTIRFYGKINRELGELKSRIDVIEKNISLILSTLLNGG